MALVRLGSVHVAVARIGLLLLAVLVLVSPAEAQFGWVKSDELVSPNPNLNAQDSGGFEITDVSANGDVVVVGAPNQHLAGFRRGAVYIYRRTSQGPLALEASFPGAADSGFFGSVVRVSGDGETVLASGNGSAVMYRRTAGVWAEFPTSSGITIGLDISTDGSRIFHGVDHSGANWTEVSAAGIVTGVTEPWAVGPIDPQEFLNAQSPVTRMAPDGRTIVVGTPYAGGGSGIPGAGIAYVLSWSAGEWQITKLLASDDFPEDQFGAAVVVSNDGATVVVSAPNKFVANGKRGQLYVFRKGVGGWQPTTVEESQQVLSPADSFSQLGAWMSGLGNGRFVAVGLNKFPNDSFLVLDLVATSPWTRIAPPVCEGNIQPSRTALMSDDARTVVIGVPSCFVPNGVVFAYRGFTKPVIEWRPPSSIEYGTALSAEQFMNATADVPGTFAYSPPAGTFPEPNAATIWLTFTPQDTVNYMPVTEPRIVHVTPRPTTLLWPAPAPISIGTSLSETQLNASADVPGAFAYTPSNGTGLGVGTHTLKVVFTPADASRYKPAELTVSLTVNLPPAPTGFEATVDRNNVTFRWKRPAGFPDTGFFIEGGVLPGQVLATLATPSGATSRSFTLPTGAFYVRVHTLLGGFKSPASNEIRIFVNVPVPPNPPANLLGMVNGSEVALSWTNTPSSPPPTGLRLNVTGALTLSVPLPVGEAFTFPSVPQGTYTFTVTTVNANGASIPSNPLTLSFPSGCTGSPSTPPAMVATRNGNLVSVTWDAPATGPAVTSYRLDVTGAFVGSFPTRTRALAGRVGSGSYTLSVVAINSCGTSAATTPTTILVP